MPKSRLLNSSNNNNHFDDKELLLPNQNDNNKKSSENSMQTNYQQKQSPSSINPNSSSSIDGHYKSMSTTTTAVSRSNSRSIAKRPVSSTASSTVSSVKPNAILSLEDRDIVIIDKADYKESTSHESNIIVVEKPRKLNHQQKSSSGDIDLAELLETNWPPSAGELALALNSRPTTNGGTAHNFSSGSTSTSNSSISCHQATGNANFPTERNRSKNPLFHIGQSRVKRNVNNFVSTGNLINLDSDGSSASGSFDSNPSKCSFSFSEVNDSVLFCFRQMSHMNIGCVYVHIFAFYLDYL